MKDKESIYHVFNDLANFMKKERPQVQEAEVVPPASDPAPPPPELPDDGVAFVEAMKGVKKVEPRQKRVARPKKDDAPARPAGGPTMDEVLSEAFPLNVVNLPEYMEGYMEGTSPLVLEKLRGGAFSVQKTLDLHGFNSADASEEFHSFLEGAVQSGLRCVTVIHGRGLKSRRGPVLKEKLKEWLVRAIHRKWVVAFASSGMRAGGPGATTILLRARAQKKKLHIIG